MRRTAELSRVLRERWAQVRVRLRARAGRALVISALAIGLGGGGVGPNHGPALGARDGSATRAATMPVAGDTVTVFGPRTFDGSPGQGLLYIERFTVASPGGRLYTLRLQNGAADGSARVSSARVQLNGAEVVGLTEVNGSVAELTRTVALTEVDTIQVTAIGAAGSHVTASIIGTPDPTFTIVGPSTFTIPLAVLDSVTQFTLPAGAAPPYRVYLINGASNGTRRASGTVTVNTTPTVFTLLTGSFTKPVTLNAGSSNSLRVTLAGLPTAFVQVWLTATDTTAPVLTISAPAPGAVVGATSVNVAGSIQDHTATTVTVNGAAATVTNNTAYSAAVPLSAEGSNVLTVTAIDAAGRRTDSTRAVIRDTQAPALTVSAPADGTAIPDSVVTVSGTVLDATSVTVNVNGTPLTLNGAGAFSGQVALVQGSNVLTVTATDAAGNSSSVVRTVTRVNAPPTLTVSAPVEGATLTTTTITVRGTVAGLSPVRVTANGAQLTVQQGGAFEGEVAFVSPTSVTVRATDAAGNSTVVTRSITYAPTLPPDPATVAPPIDRSVATSVLAATEFLYLGANPIQTGVAAGTIGPVRAALLRGRVLDRGGHPASRVTVSILGHPELGQTLSRADGTFDLVVNGGSALTVSYSKPGSLPAQRQVYVGWNDYPVLPDVVLIGLDSAVTEVDFTDPIEVARGSSMTDSSGTRQATLLFEQGTQVTLVKADGGTQALSSLRVRATEYTVGPSGPAAMPASLPLTSRYTYAAELSADEAIASGSREVRFSKPVAFYLENFLDFPVGERVPVGSYDRQAGLWISSPDGRVIEILGVSAGKVDLDVTGSGLPSGAPSLDSLGITDAERVTLATLYPVGQTLWRTEHTHFTPIDWNYPGVPADAIAPNLPEPFRKEPCPPSTAAGSIIECETQVLGERIGVTGTPYTLNYSSSRIQGSSVSRSRTIPLSGAAQLPASLRRIDLEVYVGGRRFAQSLSPSLNQRFEFTWDGRDAYGRLLQGAQQLHVRVGYVYPVRFQRPPAGEATFGRVSGTTTSFDRTRGETTLWQERRGAIGVLDAYAQGIGSWTLGAHHAYDPIAKILHTGDGRRRGADELAGNAGTAAGGQFGSGGDGGPATAAGLRSPEDVAVGLDGSFYIADVGDNKVRRVDANGVITTFAGTGIAGFSGDGGPATSARLDYPSGVAVATDGSLYIVDQDNCRIRRVGLDGKITTVAGNGSCDASGDDGPATGAGLSATRVAVAPDGSLYFDDFCLIRRVGPDGIITTLAGTGVCGFSGDGGPAAQAKIDNFLGVAVGPDGSVYFSDYFNSRVRRIGPDGIITTVAGNGQSGSAGDGGPATSASFACLTGVAVSAEGSLFTSDQCSLRIRRVGPEGIITTVAGSGDFGSTGDGGPAPAATFENAFAVAVAPDGRLYVADDAPSRIREIRPVLPAVGAGNFLVASGDGGEVYEFSGVGRHLRTFNAATGSTMLTFTYDAAGRLARLITADNDTTAVERDAQGRPTAIVAPYGQRTPLASDLDGYLASVTNPAGEVVRLAHSLGGRLDSLHDPRGILHRFEYDTAGRLLTDRDAAGGQQALVRTENDNGYTVTRTTALGRATAYRFERTATDGRRRVVTPPSGHSTTATTTINDSTVTTEPDGTRLTVTRTGDPRWRMQAPFANLTSVRLPSGLTATLRKSRRATLSSADDPFSLTNLRDTVRLNGNATVTTYDPSVRRYTTTSPEGRQSFRRTDSLGRVIAEQVSGLDSVRYSYDARGRLSQAVSGGRVWQYTYDSRSRLETSTDPQGRRDSLFYDTADRLTRQVLPGGREIGFAYDSSGNITSVTPPSRPQHTFGYTPVDLTSAYGPPNVGLTTPATSYSYNLDRQLTGITRPDSGLIEFGYDGAGRPSTVSFDRGTTTFGYSGTTGQLNSITAPGGQTLGFTYDGGLPKSVSWGGTVQGSVGVSYNSDFRVNSQTVNGGNDISFAYDRDGLVTTAGALGIKRKAQNGPPERDSLGTVKSAWGFDARGLLSNSTVTSGATTLFQTSYLRDSLDRITQLTEAIQGTTTALAFTYDSAGRLFEVRRDGVLMAAYEYDPNGNRTRLTTQSGALTGSYDAQDRLTSYGTASYTYTANGELKTKAAGSDTTRYVYDRLGNLVSVTLPGGTTVEYVIDGQNRRVGRKVNGALVQGFLYENQLEPIAELNGSNQVVSRFVYGTKGTLPDYMVKGGVTYRVVSDHLGSVRLVLNSSSGAIVQRLDYDEFGRVTQNTNPGFQPFGYAGGLLDEQTGLVRFGARDYDPTVGRWTAKDPIQFGGGDPNLYAYVQNDPVNFLDPAGFSPGFGECLASCTADYYGLGDLLLRGAVAAGSIPLSKSALGLPVVGGASSYTNPISYFGFKFFPEANLPFRVLGTTRVFGVLGRLNPWIGAGLLAYDAYNIGSCVNECMKRGFCPTEDQ